MELSEIQQGAVREWVSEGAGLSEIQRRLESEFGMNLTFMDVRFLVIDLGLEIRDRKASTSPKMPPAEPQQDGNGPEEAEDMVFQEEPPVDGAGLAGVSIELDRITQPGAVVSGTVTFSDGVTASWMLDQLGRLALQSAQQGYTPSEQDVQAFQVEIQKALARHGF